MNVMNDLLAVIPEGQTESVTIGLHWTAVVADVAGKRRCGLASTLTGVRPHGEVDVPMAGTLSALSGRELVRLALTDNPALRSIGLAAINALLSPAPESWIEGNAEDVIAEAGSDRTVVLVGHFPFIPSLRSRVGQLAVLEQNPGPGEYPAQAATEWVPQADVLAVTSMTLLNGTLEGLLALRRPEARVLLLGPSTPLHPLLFDYGIAYLSGASVVDIDAVLSIIREGAVFRQVRKAGVRLVTIARP